MCRSLREHLKKKIDTNFAYAILAILSTGFFLWTSITAFIVEHDIDNMMMSYETQNAGKHRMQERHTAQEEVQEGMHERVQENR